MRSLKIVVAGQTLQLRSDADEAYLQKLADQVTERFRALKKSAGPRQDQDFKAMTMVAIALLDELHAAQTRVDGLRSRAREFAMRMIGKIDELLGRGAG